MTKESSAGAGEHLLSAIEDHTAVCGILGLGYVGLPLAVELASAGYRVIGFDVSERVVGLVNNGRSHIGDVPAERLAAFVGEGLIQATTDMSRLSECDAISICVPTPLSKTRDPDVSYVVAATNAIGNALRAGQLIILESTTYPGTTRELVLPALEATGLEAGRDFFLCFSPERVDPGNARWHTRNTPKVLGGLTPRCLEAGTALYGRVMERVVPVSSTEAAELTKLLENTFRAVNIALVNEMAQICDRLDVDVWEVIDAAATKPFGYMKFLPGPGIGGHCIPLDPHYLSWKMKTLNYRTRLIEQGSEINAEMPHFVVNKVQDALNGQMKPLNGSRVLVLGVAYKPDIDDVRESPALDVMRLLQEKGAWVDFHDPHVPSIRDDQGELRSIALTEDTLATSDCVVIITNHRALDYAYVVKHAPLVVDTRNATLGMRAEHIVGLSGRPTMAGPIEAAVVLQAS